MSSCRTVHAKCPWIYLYMSHHFPVPWTPRVWQTECEWVWEQYPLGERDLTTTRAGIIHTLWPVNEQSVSVNSFIYVTNFIAICERSRSSHDPIPRKHIEIINIYYANKTFWSRQTRNMIYKCNIELDNNLIYLISEKFLEVTITGGR